MLCKGIFFICNVFNFVLLGQLTFNYFKMHLLNNQLCLYLILCLCKQIYTICTPRTELVHRTFRNDHRSALFAFKTNLFIDKYMQYISGVSFFESFKLLYAPKEILILDLEISEFKIFVLLF